MLLGSIEAILPPRGPKHRKSYSWDRFWPYFCLGSKTLKIVLLESILAILPPKGSKASKIMLLGSIGASSQESGIKKQGLMGLTGMMGLIQKALEKIQRAPEKIQKALEKIQKALEKIQKALETIQKALERIQRTLERIQRALERIQRPLCPKMLSWATFSRLCV